MENMDFVDYNYYLHKTYISKPEMVESLFNQGLKSRYRYSMHSTMYPVDEQTIKELGLAQTILNYLGSDQEYNAVVVIKVPKKYFSTVIHRDGKIDPSIPLFREYQEVGTEYNALFTARLIQGVYCRDINMSFTNPNFSPVFDPSGCQFSDEQIMAFDGLGKANWREFARARRNLDFKEIYYGDKSEHTWDEVIKYYEQKYRVKMPPIGSQKYVMSEDEKKLFNTKKRS